MSLKQKIISVTIRVVGTQLIQNIVEAITGFVVARIYGPSIQGAWSTGKAFAGLGGLSSLGLPFIVRRDVPVLIGEKQVSDAEYLAAIAFTFTFLTATLTSIGLIVYSFFITDYYFYYSLLTIAAIIIINSVNGFGNIIAKGLNKYEILNKTSLFRSGLLILSLPFLYFFGFPALLGTEILISLVYSFIYYKFLPFGFKFKWDSNKLKYLLKASFPIFLTSSSYLIFNSLDRFIIADKLGFTEVGFYSISTMTSLPVLLVISNLSIILFTHLNEVHGKDTSNIAILRHFDVPVAILMYLLPVILFLIVFLLPPIVSLLLPKYNQGVFPAQIFLFSVYYTTTSGFVENAIFVLNKQKMTFYFFLVQGVVKTALLFVLISLNFGIVGVAIGNLLAIIIYNILLQNYILGVVSFKLLLRIKKILVYNLPIMINFVLFLSFFYLENGNIGILISVGILAVFVNCYFSFLAFRKISEVFF